VSVTQSKEQSETMKEAIEGWRKVESILDRMKQLTRLRICESLANIRRCKQLTKRVLGVR